MLKAHQQQRPHRRGRFVIWVRSTDQ